jgi:hypothetical protein
MPGALSNARRASPDVGSFRENGIQMCREHFRWAWWKPDPAAAEHVALFVDPTFFNPHSSEGPFVVCARLA